MVISGYFSGFLILLFSLDYYLGILENIDVKFLF